MIVEDGDEDEGADEDEDEGSEDDEEEGAGEVEVTVDEEVEVDVELEGVGFVDSEEGVEFTGKAEVFLSSSVLNATLIFFLTFSSLA